MKVPVYIVSLLRDDARRAKISAEFSALDIDFNYFDAIDAKDPCNRVLIDSMRDKGVGNEMTDGEIACTLSHQFIYQKMVAENIKWALILEDDVTVDFRLKKFLSMLTNDELRKLKKDNLYLLGGQKGLHDYPVLGLSLFNKEKISTCTFRRVNYNQKKIRRTCCYLMNNEMARQLIELTNVYGTYRADSWKLMHQEHIINNFYLDEIISHPVLNISNSHLEVERMQMSEHKQPRSYFNKRSKIIRSWVKVVFFSFLK
ncbi:beta-1,4-galactosyltransferase [Citrobacter amalonaticus]|uniref:Beta-1,4-galactosyltransferase n=1 Tax=Citrobacter amalonaticus TaxID=35703 RepID=A0A2S4RVE7_CITAM|nr:glycosyltransferase family 25 protein [Citrobacter amalonaticus]POT55636.1 beta-1,4-galactosyltransferase [Citrobacter amalonaticus]POT73848.1 beta-1,4-galactosyltransferase [Citrobacter amalonaticus]POU64073.1 beta-1,4-galactosyltransferase [Citrobacter amalonaticus]POV03705.1 beta-1,4-galactosyltransferase [Citrobacter amalonaticus]